MKKKTKVWPLVVALILILAILGISVYYIVEDESILDVFKENKKLEIIDFKEALEHKGLVISNTTNKIGELIGATEGYSYSINGVDIEVYKFDENSSEELTKNNIKSAKEKGTITMPDFNNITFNALYNKGLVLLSYEQHPDKDKIIEIFNSL